MTDGNAAAQDLMAAQDRSNKCWSKEDRSNEGRSNRAVDRSPGDHFVTSIEQLEAIYGAPQGGAIAKEIDHVNAHYRAFIAAAPFCAVATSGPGGLDCTPRGDPPGFVHVRDEKTLLIPDRRGNNRIDTLRNLLDDPRISLLFLIPGCAETLRVNGRAAISINPALCESFIFAGKTPRSVIVVTVERVYFQCPKALVRSRLWDPAAQIDRNTLPSTGTILAAITKGALGGPEHDRTAPERLKATIY
jgi:PPOX class probable FMN-dependent enzyme